MKLTELRRLDEARVYKAGVLAGILSRTPYGVRFDCDAGYGGRPVATTLPLGAPHLGPTVGALPAYFAGLLPEGRRLSALRRAVKTSLDDELTLLLAIGADPIGDVQVTPPGVAPELPVVADPPDLASVRFADLFARVVATEPEDRVGLPGVQDKLSGRLLSVPVPWGPRPSILKLNPPEFRHLVENEAFFLDAARRSGLVVPEFEVVRDRDGATGLLVARFDRQATDGAITLLGQEDGCQTMNAHPAQKYRFAAEEVVGALSRACDARAVAALVFLRQLAFGYLTGNGDQHAKNLSIVARPDGEWRASPAYDLPSTYPYGDSSLALSIGGKDREDVGRAEFVALGAAVGVKERAVDAALDDLCDAAPTWIARLAELPFPARTTHKLRRAAAWRRERLGRRSGFAGSRPAGTMGS